MTSAVSIHDCEILIKREQHAIKQYYFFGLTLFLIGIITFAAGMLMSNGDTTKSLLSIGGVFISSIPSLQIKEIIAAKRKIFDCEILKSKIKQIEETADINTEQKNDLKLLIIDLYKKISG